MKKKALPKKKTVSKLKKKAWDLCSKVTRLKYADDNGYVRCYTCEIKRHYKDSMQAGHGFGGRSKVILFMEEIIRPQCYGCNCCMSGKLDIFTYKLRKELGNKKFEELYLEAHQDKGQWTVEELEEEVKRWKKKLSGVGAD